MDTNEIVDWEKKLEEKLALIIEKETEKSEREKDKEGEKISFKLLQLCKELVEAEGTTWEKSKERRLEEKRIEEEKNERPKKAENKKNDLLIRIEKRKLQRRISDALKSQARNRIILLVRQEEKERQILLEETKLVLWRKWRQKKGRN